MKKRSLKKRRSHDVWEFEYIYQPFDDEEVNEVIDMLMEQTDEQQIQKGISISSNDK